ncbi:MAG: hypothetical protein WCC64_07160 [Aliidongia sp.]
MKAIYVTSASMLALSIALGTTANAGPVGAPRAFTTNIADYNAAEVALADGVVTVPAGLATYAVNGGGGNPLWIVQRHPNRFRLHDLGLQIAG